MSTAEKHPGTLAVLHHDADWLDEHALPVARLRRIAMGGDTTSDGGRARLIRQHAALPGCRIVTLGGDEDGAGMWGLAYGFPLRPGQWWRDTVSSGIGSHATRRWLDGGFEVAELHVLPSLQGGGHGRALLAALVQARDGTVVLSTPDRDTRARRLYRRAGFGDLSTGFLFSGDPTAYAILGADLPLRLGAHGEAERTPQP